MGRSGPEPPASSPLSESDRPRRVRRRVGRSRRRVRVPSRRRPGIRGALALLAVAAVALRPAPAGAQEPSWAVEGRIGGSVFYGNQSQVILTTRGEVERADSLFESSANLRFSYGQATDDDGVRSVNRRSWLARTTLDLLPAARLRPFLSGRIESSLERRIALRYDAGTGIRGDLYRSERGRVDLSTSVVAERTFPRDPDPDDPSQVTVARLASRIDARRAVADGRVELRSDNRYEPVFDDLGNFTFISTNSISFELTEVVSLALTFEEEYDSGAVARGAETNRQGEIEVSLAARF